MYLFFISDLNAKLVDYENNLCFGLDLYYISIFFSFCVCVCVLLSSLVACALKKVLIDLRMRIVNKSGIIMVE